MTSLWLETNPATLSEIALKFDSISLKSWGLSVRTLNALLSHNFKWTVGDVIRASESLASIKDLGKMGVKEIYAKLVPLLAPSYTQANGQFVRDQHVLPPHIKAPLGPQPKLLPLAIQSLSLNRLHLDIKTHRALAKAGIMTVGELYYTQSARLRALRGFHSTSLSNINASLVALLNAINSENQVNWLQCCQSLAIEVLPSGDGSEITTEHIFKNIPALIEEVLRREYNERAWIVVQRRHGVGGVERVTLEEIGDVYGLSRERIRQIEKRALEILRSILIEQDYTGKNYHVHPVVHLLMRTIRNIVAEEPSHIIVETRLLERIGQQFNANAQAVQSSLFLLMALIGAQGLEIDYQTSVPLREYTIPIWGHIEPTLEELLENGVKSLNNFLTWETVLPQTEQDIFLRLQKEPRKFEQLTLLQFSWLIDLCASIERRDDGLIWGKFECLQGRGNQVKRILTETESPMSITDIADQINHRLVHLGYEQITEADLFNQIMVDNRFVALGYSGKWGLKSWSHIEIKAERRVWTKEQVADFVAGIFRSHEAEELDYGVLKKALMKEAGITAGQVRGMLNSNPVIRTRAKKAWGGKRIAIFQPNYKEVMEQAKLTPFQPQITLYRQIEERAHSILEAAPDKQMPARELVQRLHQEFECSVSIHNFLKIMDSIEQTEIVGTRQKMCRSKRTTVNILL
ncbi:MAG TPA: DNA-directed RNA polymerase subunit alpha C-terminal domain-containing protein [Ktedonobacteraceae bacterium]|nr:DNA-directed RNA polymerase subunit alpha C-terminal domain-containing protein [Ktedonobacteraceae bacterium]